MLENMQENKNFGRAAVALVVILCLYFGMRFLSEVRAYGSTGSGEVNTITLSGHGEVTAVPDIANVSFTIEKEAKTAKEAQEKVAEVEKKALEFLKTSKVEDKDIKASTASVYPKYEYQYKSSVMPCNEFGCPPRGGNNVIVGYTASESITVKVRNVDDAGKIMQGLGEAGVSQMNGPDFAIDEEDALKAEARKLAIMEAREKARVLAKDLGVRLGKVVTYSESDYAMPFYARAVSEDMVMGGAVKSAPAELPKGENTISAHVNVTFEIR
jgi:hypothetical protein